jgi:molecular chaperone HtpG
MKYQIEITKVLEILSTKIYDSPFALLRENVQNAYDAVLLRNYRFQGTFEPRIDVKITDKLVEVHDNGIGMTEDDLRNHFWRAGASGKNNSEAISAGVVGTFGIGGLANFGICQKLVVTTESAINGSRTRCQADKDTLSLENDCILIEKLDSTQAPGTLVSAFLPENRSINIEEATKYLREFVEHVPIPVYINGELVSTKNLEESCSIPDGKVWSQEVKEAKTDYLQADVKFLIAEFGIIWLELKNMILQGNKLNGRVLLKQGVGQIMAFRSGFGLARTGVYSTYSFGGVADLKILQPTAGRDALTNASVQVIQAIVNSAEQIIAPIIAESPYTDMNTSFMSWVSQKGKFELLGNLKVSLLPNGKRVTLKEIKELSEKIPINYYNGSSDSVAKELSSEDAQLIHISRSNPRARCESEYLSRFTKAKLLSGEPRVLTIQSDASWNREQAALAFKIGQVLASDYFVQVRVQFGFISHNLPLLIKEDSSPPILTLDTQNSTVQTILNCYTTDYFGFGSLTIDFIRTILFPRISHLVPSSAREGAEAFLKVLRHQRDTFEYDRSEIRQLDDVIADFAKGNVSFSKVIDAALTAAKKQQQTVAPNDVQKVTSIMPDMVSNQRTFEAEENDESKSGVIKPVFAAKPAILRKEVETDAKILVLEDNEVMFGYKGLLRLSEKAYIDRGEFFYQPHFTEIIWGGQRIIYIFRHISGAFGFYYDIQLNELLNIPPGGTSFESMSVILKNSVFLPIPHSLFKFFAPEANEKKRFDVRYDILYPEI